MEGPNPDAILMTRGAGAHPGRRTFLRVSGAAGAAALAVSCAPAAAPSRAPVEAPGAPATSGWQQEWDRTVAAARQEGKVVWATITGPGYRRIADAFEEAYPGIKVEHTGWASFNQFTPRIIQEREAGIYAWDVTAHVADVHLNPGTIGPAGGLDPLRPALIRSDVLEDRNWRGGFEIGWLDQAKRLGYGFVSTLGGRNVWINTDLISESEVKGIKDLLQPKLKGRMIFVDPRISGHTYYSFTAARLNLGSDEILKQVFVDQEPAITRDPRQAGESLVRGRYALTMLTSAVINEFRDAGVAPKIKLLELPEMLFESSTTGVWLINRAPHPNAAKVFINWLLGKDGQTAWAKQVVTNSRRVDTAPGDPDAVLTPGRQFKVKIGDESMALELRKTQDIATEVMK